MYLIINNTRHSVSKRIVTEDTVKYLSVTPAPEEISGIISMYRNDGFLMSEDNADNYQRRTYVGTLLQISNAPEPEPIVPEHVPTLEEELATAIKEGVDSL